MQKCIYTTCQLPVLYLRFQYAVLLPSVLIHNNRRFFGRATQHMMSQEGLLRISCGTPCQIRILCDKPCQTLFPSCQQQVSVSVKLILPAISNPPPSVFRMADVPLVTDFFQAIASSMADVPLVLHRGGCFCQAVRCARAAASLHLRALAFGFSNGHFLHFCQNRFEVRALKVFGAFLAISSASFRSSDLRTQMPEGMRNTCFNAV